MNIPRVTLSFGLLASLSACGTDGIRPMAGYAPPPVASSPQATQTVSPNKGAIFQATNGYASLHEGLRARAVGDIVTIVLVENIISNKNTASQTARGGSLGITPPTTGPLSFLNPDDLKAAADASFNGTGNASQRSTLNGAISVSLAEVRPNGTARVVGEKFMALSQGDEFVQFSGIIRLADVDAQNRVLSTQVADARIVYSGRGPIQRASKPGWLSAFFAKISPF